VGVCVCGVTIPSCVVFWLLFRVSPPLGRPVLYSDCIYVCNSVWLRYTGRTTGDFVRSDKSYLIYRVTMTTGEPRTFVTILCVRQSIPTQYPCNTRNRRILHFRKRYIHFRCSSLFVPTDVYRRTLYYTTSDGGGGPHF